MYWTDGRPAIAISPLLLTTGYLLVRRGIWASPNHWIVKQWEKPGEIFARTSFRCLARRLWSKATALSAPVAFCTRASPWKFGRPVEPWENPWKINGNIVIFPMIAIFHRDNDQLNHWVQWGTLLCQEKHTKNTPKLKHLKKPESSDMVSCTALNLKRSILGGPVLPRQKTLWLSGECKLFFVCPQSKRLTFGIVWINHLVVVIVVDVLPSLTCWPVERTLRTCHKFWKETCVHHLVSLAYHVTNDRDCNFRSIFEKQIFRQGETSAHIQPHPSAPWRGEEDKSRSHPATLLDPGRSWCLPTKPKAS